MSLSNAEADQRTLAAIVRSHLAAQNPHKSARVRFAEELRAVAHLLLDGWDSPDALFPQQVFEDHGPARILRALVDAYEHPEPILDDEVPHP